MDQHIIHILCLCCMAAPFVLVHVPKLSTYQSYYMLHSHSQRITHDFLLFIVPFYITGVVYIFFFFTKRHKTHFHYNSLWLMTCKLYIGLNATWLHSLVLCANFQNVWPNGMGVIDQRNFVTLSLTGFSRVYSKQQQLCIQEVGFLM